MAARETSLLTRRKRWRLRDALDVHAKTGLDRRGVAIGASREAPMAVFANDHIGNAIAFWGIYERDELELVFGFLAPFTDRFAQGAALDVGANIGNHTRYFAQRFRRVHAFEPHPLAFRLLAFNTERLDGVAPHAFGLSDSEQSARLAEASGNVGASHVAAGEEGVEIRLRRLDQCALGDEPVALIKLDVEGLETAALRGGEATIARHRPVILFEQLAEAFDGDETPAIRLLRKWNYRICWFDRAGEGGSLAAKLLRQLRFLLAGRPMRIATAAKATRRTYTMMVAIPAEAAGAVFPADQRSIGSN